MKKAIPILLAALLALTAMASLSACDNSKPSGQLKIGILKWVTHGALDAAEQGFIDALRDNGYTDGENITLDKQNANDNSTTAASIADKFVNNQSDLILAIATPAVQSVQSKTETIPVLGTAVTDYVRANLVESNANPGKNISGTSDLTPIAEQFDMLLQVLPHTQTVGIIYNSSEDNSAIQAEDAKMIAESKGLSVVIRTFSSINDIPQTAASLAREVDAFWVPTDNMLASAMNVLIERTMENSIPVVCGEENMVKGGGTFTIGITYYELGYQTGEMAARILKDGASPANMPIEFQNKMAVAIHKANADALGIVFPAEILAVAVDLSE
jgi:putative ABC transport system substrate-binding protein